MILILFASLYALSSSVRDEDETMTLGDDHKDCQTWIVDKTQFVGTTEVGCMNAGVRKLCPKTCCASVSADGAECLFADLRDVCATNCNLDKWCDTWVDDGINITGFLNVRCYNDKVRALCPAKCNFPLDIMARSIKDKMMNYDMNNANWNAKQYNEQHYDKIKPYLSYSCETYPLVWPRYNRAKKDVFGQSSQAYFLCKGVTLPGWTCSLRDRINTDGARVKFVVQEESGFSLCPRYPPCMCTKNDPPRKYDQELCSQIKTTGTIVHTDFHRVMIDQLCPKFSRGVEKCKRYLPKYQFKEQWQPIKGSEPLGCWGRLDLHKSLKKKDPDDPNNEIESPNLFAKVMKDVQWSKAFDSVREEIEDELKRTK